MQSPARIRPFNHDGLSRRAAPFAAATLVALALVHLQADAGDALEAIAAVSLTAVILAAIMFAPWERLSGWAQAAPPLAFFAVVALLRDAQGGPSSAYTPLVLLPVFWLGLYGTPAQLVVALAGAAATLTVPIAALHYPVGEWTAAAVWIGVAAFVGIAIHGLVRELRGRAALLEAASRIDFVTGLDNRGAWEQALPRELARARRDGKPLCVALLDLDDFKVLNDERGHQAGDRVLKECASAWASTLRTTDVIARFGGDEFSLVLPGCGIEDALMLIERLRSVTPLGQTVSAGVAGWDGLEPAATLVARADRALYESKRSGRDCTAAAR